MLGAALLQFRAFPYCAGGGGAAAAAAAAAAGHALLPLPPPLVLPLLPSLPPPLHPMSQQTCLAACRYEFFADELPIWGFVGPPPEQTKGDDTVYIYTHKTFDIAYNGDRVRGGVGAPCGDASAASAASRRCLTEGPSGAPRVLPSRTACRLCLQAWPATQPAWRLPCQPQPPQIIHINLTSENPQPIKGGTQLTFTYEVRPCGAGMWGGHLGRTCTTVRGCCAHCALLQQQRQWQRQWQRLLLPGGQANMAACYGCQLADAL